MDEVNKEWLQGRLNFYFKYKRKIVEGLIEGKCLNVGCGGHLIKNAVNIDKDATKLPYKDNSFDTVILSDVIEHIEDWQKALTESIRVSSKKVIITVPAYQWLWSNYDKSLGHYRRYSSKDIKEFFKKNNVNCDYRIKFLFGPLLPLYYIRKFTSGKTPDLSSSVNSLFYGISHIRLPFGPTMLVEIKKC
ncbi:MAG: methyltransferase domain-containing protein [Candidatus Nanoarchaeia archaeon]|nr:methyltransferase domain-containing protein [Candidatus Nanoarchaeia archaeon]MDD5587592.1 methyltransferase domain-containing protein [Candidatus Nanoarchaeia archaeon]